MITVLSALLSSSHFGYILNSLSSIFVNIL
nr:MAG TPA: hypothetical protein [Bacteriophage sp.]